MSTTERANNFMICNTRESFKSKIKINQSLPDKNQSTLPLMHRVNSLIKINSDIYSYKIL
jgi:hypothetical protein